MKKMNKKGFTIVELVIVIAVIGILAGVLIPTFTIVVRKANESAAMQALDTARKEYMTVVDAAADDFAAFDTTYAYYISADKKGQNYDHLAGIWKFENGAWVQKVANATTDYHHAYDQVKATAFDSNATYYALNGTTPVVVTSETFADADRYIHVLVEDYSGVAIYVHD